MDKHLKLIISPEEIQAMVEAIAADITARFPSKRPVLVGILKGAAVFFDDLTRELGPPLEVDFIQASSYSNPDSPSSKVRITNDISLDIKGRDVIIVDGIVDRGKTVRSVTAHLGEKEPASLSFCTLLLREGTDDIEIEYVGRRIPEGFIVGYGMDYKEDYRELDAIYMLTKNKDIS